ncbi:MAG: DinB family protein [Vicinamibacterales bacterium]
MAVRRALNVEQEIVEAFEHSGQVTEYLVSVLPRELWQRPSPTGHGRTIAAMVAHIHGVRRTFAKMGGASVPPSLDRNRVTVVQASRALRQTNSALTTLFRDSLQRGETRVKGMPRRSVNMMAYLIEHDAHHRGQIMIRARELGHTFAGPDVMRVWGWKRIADS